MTMRDVVGRSRLLFAGLALVFVASPAAHAQKLAFRSYQVSDGLAHGVVISLHQDAKGYLWLATYEGLSRFDGYRFTNYGADAGLGHAVVNDVASDRRGQLWVALNGGGVARLVDGAAAHDIGSAKGAASAAAFTTYLLEPAAQHPANAVNRILFDADNRLWCVTDAGLYRARNVEVASLVFERVVAGSVPYFNNAALADNRGRLWFGVGNQVIQVAGGRMTTYRPAHGTDPRRHDAAAWQDIHTIVEDERGRVLAAETTGLYEFVDTAEDASDAWRRWPLDVPVEQGIRGIAPARGGGLWIATIAGLIRYSESGSKLYTTENGLSSNRLRALLRDREENLWIATEGSGLSKLSAEGSVSYTTLQGLPSPEVYHLVEGRDGRMYAMAGCAPRAVVAIDHDIVRTVPAVPLAVSQCYKSHLTRDALNRTWFHTKTHVLQDVKGRWWFHSPRGLEVVDGPALDPRNARGVGAAEGFAEDFYSELYQDADGRIWIVNGVTGNLYVADPRDAGRPRFRLVRGGLTNAEFLLRDRAGTLWVASSTNIWRISHAGTISEVTVRTGLPAIEPRALYQDRRGRLWIGLRYNGVSMTADPDAPEPHFVNYTTANGLASDAVWSIADDDEGHVYLGTGRGLDRFDVASKTIRHLTAEDGVVGSVIEHLVTDRDGRIWVASDGGITRLDPRGARPSADQPPVFISDVRIAGETWPLPVTGAQHVAPIELPASRNNVTIRFVGLSYRSEKAIRYQYRLDGAETGWSEPSEQREVNFARLAPGRYRFLVRAVTSGDVESAQQASVTLHILPPVYLRAWFVALAVLSVAAVVYAAYRYRVAGLLEVANIRNRIASDLHDDIGANLSKIAILSEVAQRQPASVSPGDNPLAAIARISRESVASMSDIVWAINPKRDSLQDLVRRMRLHAEEACVPRSIALDFRTPDRELFTKIGADARRDLFLIFKEAVNNAVRHSGCAHLHVALAYERGGLSLTVRDDGRGFDPAGASDGNGVINMRRRAEGGGALLDIASGPAQGTTILLTYPNA
jgi:ligand-binding sensor domain-containing protein/signal transduction histidine kinase